MNIVIHLRGVILSFVSILSATSLFSCTKRNENTFFENMPTDTVHSTNHFLALGDSYTIGESVAIQDRYPDQAVRSLRDSGVGISDPEIIATTGWTTHDLISAIDANPPQTEFSFVTLLIGVNNQFQGKSIEEYRNEFSILLNRAIRYAGNKKNRVFVLSIPDYSVTPFAASYDTARIAREIDAFNQVNKSITMSAGVTWIDITGISREAKHDGSLLAGDGLHPSGKQYKRWADLLVPVMNEAIKH
jgi:lysophospholipase L1-like esterase